MNATQIAALYTPLVASLLATATPTAEQELLGYLLRRREDNAISALYEVRVRNFAPLGVSLAQRCPLRVFTWASAQLPATDQRQAGGESWSAMTADYTTPQGEFEIRFSIGADFATLLRGLCHYQRKLNRRTRKQLAQLRAYHAQQLASQALVTASPAAPAVSCYGLSADEYHRRLDAAEDLEEQLRARYNRPDGRYGREIMWHPAFADEYVAVVSETALLEIAVACQVLAGCFNQGRPLDCADYGYLADLLRDALTAGPTAQAALRLARALAWIEQAGAALLATQPTALLSETAAPVLSAAA